MNFLHKRTEYAYHNFFFLAVVCTAIAAADTTTLSVKAETVGLSSQRLTNIDKLVNKHIEEKKM